MSSERRSSRFLVALLVACASASCADFRRGATWDEVDEDDDDAFDPTGEIEGELRFEADIHPLLLDGCASCHEPGALDYAVSDDVAASHQSALRFVDFDDPERSRLLHKARGDGHGGGTIYPRTSEEYASILAWIEQGAVP